MIEALLNSEETDVFILNRFEHVPVEKLTVALKKRNTKYTHYSDDDVTRILNSIKRKNSIAASPSRFRSFIDKYLRIFEVSRSHYQEERDGIKHVFSIDFADLHVYLNPSAIKPQNRENIGSIYYMFNSKGTHDYCMLPPASWELLDNLYGEYKRQNKKYDEFMKDTKIKNFYHFLKNADKNKPEMFANDLMAFYQDTGGWIDILLATAKNELDRKLSHNLTTLIAMSNANVIRPLHKEEANKVEVDKKVYKSVLSELSCDRPELPTNNKIDALNLALTYSLTDKSLTNANKADDFFYRMVSHSKWPSRAYRTVTYDNKAISCCPQFVSTLNLNERGIIKLSDDFLDENIRRLRRLSGYCFDLQSTQKFTSKKHLDQYKGRTAEFKAEIVSPIQHYLGDYIAFERHVYEPVIQHVMDINSGHTKYVKRDGCFENKEDIETLKQIFDEKTYETVAKTASELIYQNLEKTYKVLYDYVNENHMWLDPEMIDLMNAINNRTARDV